MQSLFSLTSRAIAFFVALGTAAAVASETDQYSRRSVPLAESLEVADAWVDTRIREVAESWKQRRDDDAFARVVKQKVAAGIFIHNSELWMHANDEIQKINRNGDGLIYKGAPFFSGPVVVILGVAGTIQLAGSRLGIDKIGHFLSMGYHYFHRERSGQDFERILKWGRDSEYGFLGRATTGVMSNADLVANYEGYLFYRSLFEDDIVPGKPAIVRWEDGMPVVQRSFTWADHINDFFDEALNPNFFSVGMAEFIRERLSSFCGDYRANPDVWVPRNEAELTARYEQLGMETRLELRLDHLCQ